MMLKTILVLFHCNKCFFIKLNNIVLNIIRDGVLYTDKIIEEKKQKNCDYVFKQFARLTQFFD